MKIYRAYKTQIKPNNSQLTHLRQAVGNARFSYNWALSIKKTALESSSPIPNAIELHRKINVLKKSELDFLYLSSKCVTQEALRDCDKAFQNFFREIKKKNKKVGFPKFKSKKNDKQSFRLTGTIKVLDGYIQLPRLGKIKLFEKDYLPKDSKILSATVSKRADRWFVSIQVEEEYKEKSQGNGTIGVDLGIKTLATCSDGTTYENPKALKKNLKKLKRKQRQLSRKKKGSKNREKAKNKLSKLHYRISNIRKDCLHKATSEIIQKNNVIILEDLKISNMIKNHKLAQAISDVGMYEFKRQVEYKSIWNRRLVIYADQYFPSSRQCSCCGHKKDKLGLGERTYSCSNCGMNMDRDLNAAKNLEQLYTPSSGEIYAFGDGSSLESEKTLVSPSSN